MDYNWPDVPEEAEEIGRETPVMPVIQVKYPNGHTVYRTKCRGKTLQDTHIGGLIRQYGQVMMEEQS